MSERKVLNKYYPPDYDPSKIPKGKRNRNATFNIRIMAPFNMRCNMCKEYIYKGKKFNSRKEDVEDEDYLGLKIFRFYIKCPRCVSEIAFKTDLQNTDYTLEAGAKRLFEAEKIAQQMAEEERKAKEEEEMNPMKLLENRTKQSRQEMEQIDTLEELRELNTRKNLVNTDEMIETYRKYEQLLAQVQMEKEEQEIKDIFGDKTGQVVKRLNDSDSDEEEPARKKLIAAATTGAKPTDILSEESTSEVKPKKPQIWEKSVGSLSSKQKLKGLVAVKKKVPSQVPSTSLVRLTSAEKESSNNINILATTKIGTNPQSSDKINVIGSDRDIDSSKVVENGQKETDFAAELVTSARGNKGTESSENSAEVEKGTCKISTTAGNVSGDGSRLRTVQVANTGSKPAGSGLLALGAYSDSESDNSE